VRVAACSRHHCDLAHCLRRRAAAQAEEEEGFQDHTYQVLHLASSSLQMAALLDERCGGGDERCG
jgi:hypothetical protein